MPCEPPLLEMIAVLMPIDFAAKINQRTAAVPGIDRRVGLQEIAETIDPVRTSFRADDSVRHRFLESKWISDREHKIAGLHLVGVAKLERFDAGLVHFQNREIECASAPIKRAFRVRPSLNCTSISST